MIKDFLLEICSSNAVSSHEYKNSEIYDKYFGKYTDNVIYDRLGGQIYIKNGTNDKRIMLAAHGDEIGLMINSINEGGFLGITAIGGVPAANIVGQEIIVYGKEPIYGVIGIKPPHIMTKEDREKKLTLADLYIDTGYSLEKLKQLVTIGDTASVKISPISLNGSRISSKAMDDKAGIAVMYGVAKQLERIPHKSNIYFSITSQEEVGIKGAGPAAYTVKPDMAIIFDVCMGNSCDISGQLDLGKGPAIAIGGRLHPGLTKKFIEICKENKYDYQIDPAPHGTSTDTENISISEDGVPCMLISIPTRYVHTVTETIDFSDIESISKCVALFINELDYISWEELLCF